MTSATCSVSCDREALSETMTVAGVLCNRAMERKLAFLFGTVFCVSAFSQDVQVLLSLENSKTTYRSGEPIRLVLSFTALRGNYLLNTGTGKPMSPGEWVAITPPTGGART